MGLVPRPDSFDQNASGRQPVASASGIGIGVRVSGFGFSSPDFSREAGIASYGNSSIVISL